MSKILQVILSLTMCFCVGLAFVGCSEKERSTEDIRLEYEKMLTENAEYFDAETGEFNVQYSNSVEVLITNDGRANLLTSYFEPVAKSAYAFFVQIKDTISDKMWSKKSRISIYNNLKNMREALNEFDNAKQRFQTALASYSSGLMSTIELVDYASFVKEYKDFIDVIMDLGNASVDAFFGDFYKEFYDFSGNEKCEAYVLQILLKHKAFDIAKSSIALEYNEYFDINSTSFSNRVFNGNTTILCGELNKINALLPKAKVSISKTETTKLNDFTILISEQKFFDAQMEVLSEAIKNFDFKKMRNSYDVEEVFVAGVSAEQKAFYNDIFEIAYDFIPQIVADYVTVYLTF